MKFIRPEILSTLNTQYGSEPIIVVSIAWDIQFDISNYNGVTNYTDQQIKDIIAIETAKSSFGFYADKDILDGNGNIIIPGKIISISEIESSVDFANNASSSQVTVVIDDTDNSILGILKTSNIHLRPVQVYLYFQGMQISDMICIFEGVVVSDFRWIEKTKQVTFNFLSRIEEKEVGFSPEQGYIKDLPLEMIGRPWPFGFGDIVKYPALRINYTPTAVLVDPFGIHDWSLDIMIAMLKDIKKNYSGIAEAYAKAALQAYFSGFKDLGDQLTELTNQVLAIIQQKVEPDKLNYEQIRTEQVLYENGLDIGPGGSGSGNIDVITDVPITLSGLFQVGDLVVQGKLGPSGNRTGKLTINNIVHPYPGSTTWGNNYTPPSVQPFIFVQSGTTVEFLGKYPLRYLVNTIGGTVQGVYAYRTFEGLKRLQPVPTKYWKVISVRTIPPGVITTVPTFSALCIELTQPLSTLRNQFWEDDLYVSYQSSVGPSLKDILNFLVGYYTTYRIDSGYLAKLPDFHCSFVLPDQKDVMAVIKEICFQNNIACWTNLGVFYFLYMPNFYFSRMLIDLDNIIKDSVEISISPTENIITKMKGSWRPNYQYDIRNYVAIRYNDNIYGVHPFDADYYCFNDPQSVMSSMSFWIYRKGNVWKRLKLSVPIIYLQLDLFDNVALSQAVCDKYQLAEFNGTGFILDCSLIGMKINAENWTVELELELPVYVGSKKYSPAYWLSQANGIPLWKIDENFQLTETATQTAFYARGFSIDQALEGVSLQNEIFKASEAEADALNQLWSNGLPSPNSMNGDPSTPVTTETITDVGTRNRGYTAPRVNFPQQRSQFVIADQPKWQYQYGQYPLNLQTTPPASAMPGTVDSFNKQDGDRQVYNCTVYPSGISNNTQGQQVQATQLQINKDDRIPEGTWALFILVGGTNSSVATSTGPDTVSQSSPTQVSSGGTYYFQVPIWLG